MIQIFTIVKTIIDNEPTYKSPTALHCLGAK